MGRTEMYSRVAHLHELIDEALEADLDALELLNRAAEVFAGAKATQLITRAIEKVEADRKVAQENLNRAVRASHMESTFRGTLRALRAMNTGTIAEVRAIAAETLKHTCRSCS